MGSKAEDGLVGQENLAKIEHDPEEVRSATQVIQHLVKTSKTLKLYLPDNPVPQKFIAELLAKLSLHLGAFGPLRLGVRQSQLLCSGQPVYEDTNRLESVPFRLFIDGIREIAFLPGIGREEVVDFLQVIGRGTSNDVGDDDTVTLLWERQSPHIKYLVADDFRGDVRQEQCKEMQPKPAGPEQLKALYMKEVRQDRSAITFPEKARVPSMHLFKLTESEIEKIKEEVRREEGLDMVGELEGVLFDILRVEREPVVFSEILGMVDYLLEGLMSRGDFRHALKIIEFFQEMLRPSADLPQPLREQVQQALSRAGDPKRISMLEAILDSSEGATLSDFSSLMILMGKDVIPSVVELLSVANKMKTRRFLCDVLAELGKEDIDYLVSRLNDDRWYLVRNLIYVLGNIGDPRVIKDLARFIRHSRFQVRRAVFHALDGMEDPGAEELLVHFISDPDSSTRISALKSLGRRNMGKALGPLSEVLSAEGFHGKELAEKREIFDALSRIGGDAGVPQMRAFLKGRWRLFKDVKEEETACCAVVALQKIATPMALEALREGSRSSNRTIREACKKACEAIGAGRR